MPEPTGMKTNGVGEKCDWLNRAKTLERDPEVRWAARRERMQKRWRRQSLKYRRDMAAMATASNA